MVCSSSWPLTTTLWGASTIAMSHPAFTWPTARARPFT
jgi:hypothetical protein